MLIGFFFVALTIALTVYGQLVFKWQVDLAGEVPTVFGEQIGFVFRLLLNPWVISSFAAAFLGSLTWMGALTQFELSFAYPFMSLAYVVVMVFSYFFFKESLNAPKVIGTLVIILGLFIVTRAG